MVRTCKCSLIKTFVLLHIGTVYTQAHTCVNTSFAWWASGMGPAISDESVHQRTHKHIFNSIDKTLIKLVLHRVLKWAVLWRFGTWRRVSLYQFIKYDHGNTFFNGRIINIYLIRFDEYVEWAFFLEWTV